MRALILYLLFASQVFALDFGQPDKQSHALLGCSGALLVRGFVQDASPNDHEAIYGVLGGIGAELAYEATFAAPKTAHERLLDVEAGAIGSLLCIGVAQGVQFMVNTRGVSVGGNFK